jgi:hypothetical protein
VEILIVSPVARRFAPLLSPVRILWMSFWRVTMEAPFAVVILLLSNPANPLDSGVFIVLVALAGGVALLGRHSYKVALDNRGAPAAMGEFHDAVFALAAQLNAPLKRLYIVPDGIAVHFSPTFGSKGGVVVPERLVQNLSRREMDAFIGYALLLIRSGYIRRASLRVLLSVLVCAPLAYAIHRLIKNPNEAMAALVLMVFCAIVSFNGSLQRMRARAETALSEIPGAPEGWIAAVAHASRLAGAAVPAAVIMSMAKRANIAPQQMLALTDLGLPGGPYPLPAYDRDALVTVH